MFQHDVTRKDLCPPRADVRSQSRHPLLPGFTHGLLLATVGNPKNLILTKKGYCPETLDKTSGIADSWIHIVLRS